MNNNNYYYNNGYWPYGNYGIPYPYWIPPNYGWVPPYPNNGLAQPPQPPLPQQQTQINLNPPRRVSTSSSSSEEIPIPPEISKKDAGTQMEIVLENKSTQTANSTRSVEVQMGRPLPKSKIKKGKTSPKQISPPEQESTKVVNPIEAATILTDITNKKVPETSKRRKLPPLDPDYIKKLVEKKKITEEKLIDLFGHISDEDL